MLRSKRGGATLLFIGGLVNIGGMLSFNRGFTSDVLSQFDPETFSTLGMISICLWGGAYLGAIRIYEQARLLLAVFALEKLIYAGTWLHWIVSRHAVLGQIPWMPRLFFSTYGLIDFAFGLAFAYLALRRHPGAAA
jgi:hypothetical protein